MRRIQFSQLTRCESDRRSRQEEEEAEFRRTNHLNERHLAVPLDFAGYRSAARKRILPILYQHDTRNIPQDAIGGDIENGRTENYDLLSDKTSVEWLCVQATVSPYQHYRMVIWIVGKPLFKIRMHDRSCRYRRPPHTAR